MQAFTSLEDLNKFLASKDLPPITEETISEAISKQIGQGATEGVIKLSLNADEDDQAAAEALEESFKTAFADLKDIIQPDEALSDEETLDNYIKLLTRQRDEAREMFIMERNAHDECHEAFEEQLHEMRINGYAEGIAAGLVPGVPFEQIGLGIQAAIRQQAEQGIRQIDMIRSGC